MPSSMSDPRQRIVELAERCVGLSGADMAWLCGLEGDWASQVAKPYIPGTQGISTCGLVAEGIYYLADMPVPATWRPYAPVKAADYAIARTVAWARSVGAWRAWSPKLGNPPGVGDLVIIGTGLSTHALIVIEVETDADDDGAGTFVRSVDGGMVDDVTGLQTVKATRRRMRRGMIGARPVVGWVCADAVPQ